MNLEFPLCREPRYERAVRAALAECVRVLTERRPASRLVAVILTGSFARGEGSILPLGGELKILGDLEFFVALEGRLDAGVRRLMAACGREASDRLAAGGLRAEVEFGPVSVEFFRRRARPSIFVFDLRHHGKVLWGRPDLLGLIPPFEASAIPGEDALHLTFNRIVEQLATWDRLDTLAGETLMDAAYQRLKLTLDLAGSALAFAGRHTALYRQRSMAFARLLIETPSLQARLPPEFADELAEAGQAKLDPGSHLPLIDATPEELARRMIAGRRATTVILRWELEQLLGTTGTLRDLVSRYARTRTLGHCVWDWAKLILHPLPPPLPISHLRAARLFWSSTPRALLYAAGCRAYLALGDGDGRPVDLASFLPLSARARPADATTLRRTIVALWQWGVRNS
ncbi:MAG: hypothetical protein ACREJV_04080 [Candidatus Rokuibacteriota bacterium]